MSLSSEHAALHCFPVRLRLAMRILSLLCSFLCLHRLHCGLRSQTFCVVEHLVGKRALEPVKSNA